MEFTTKELFTVIKSFANIGHDLCENEEKISNNDVKECVVVINKALNNLLLLEDDEQHKIYPF